MITNYRPTCYKTLAKAFLNLCRYKYMPRKKLHPLEKYTSGPLTGAFADGSYSSKLKIGGWAMVYVEDNKLILERRGIEEETTSNRMELKALIVAIKSVPKSKSVTIYTDSQYCVSTFNEWLLKWAKQGWKLKEDGEIKNLNLVKQLYTLKLKYSNIKVQWIRSHAGNRWNEYCNWLAQSYLR